MSHYRREWTSWTIGSISLDNAAAYLLQRWPVDDQKREEASQIWGQDTCLRSKAKGIGMSTTVPVVSNASVLNGWFHNTND